MGGSGSSRWKKHQKKVCAEDALPIDLSQIAHRAIRDPKWSSGVVYWSVADEPIATVRFKVVGDAEPAIEVTTDDYRSGRPGRLIQTFPLTRVKTLPGRFRYFAICPDCGNRAVKVYWPRERGGYACRKCSGVTYLSTQREDKRVNYFRKNPDACVAALNSGSHRSWMLALEALPPYLYPFPNGRHPGGQRLGQAWGRWFEEKFSAGVGRSNDRY